MAKKRKLDSKSTEQPQTQQAEEEKHEEYEDEEEYEEGDEYDDEEEEDDKEEEEEDDDDEVANAHLSTAPTSSAPNQNPKDDDNEPVLNLLEPFSKEQLINLLREAADSHPDVADRIRQIANRDPAHRKIFVHGLGWDTNSETIAAAFSQYGEIEDCKAVVDKISGKSKGYGFVLFKTRSGAQKALKEPQKKIGNRMTACQLASIGPVAGAAVAAPPVVPPTQPVSEVTQKKIYVSNVGAELDPQKLFSFFSKYGEIEDGPLGLDKQTGKPRGFCLFVYKTIESAKKSLEEPHKNFEGHILHCQKAIDGPKPNKIKRTPKPQFQRTENPSSYIAPADPAGMQFNQAGLNPVLGQALTALIASQGAGLGLTNLLGTIGAGGVVNPAVMPGGGHGLQGGGYGSQGLGSGIITPGVMGGYGSQGGYLPNQQMGHGGGSSRSQHGVGHMGGGAPYMGH